MNKLVIVGNGFDLAHGLPTSYKHFIDDFWANLKYNYMSPQYQSIIEFHSSFPDFIANLQARNYSDFQEDVQKYIKFHKEKHGIQIYADSSRIINVYKFQNSFFREINSKNSIENWVDIENEYYQKLKLIVKNVNWSTQLKKENVHILNQEFKAVKNLLQEYLQREVNNKYDFLNGRVNKFDYLLRFLKTDPLYLEKTRDQNDFLKQFPSEDKEELIAFDNKLIEAKEKGTLERFFYQSNRQTIFLNFNYTNSLYKYIDIMNTPIFGNFLRASEIPIHGKLNEINFGFGDEMDEDYKLIENLDDNQYLINFKSFKYSQNSNYKNFLDYIESDKFQVYIMGHSCGLSDRTLLNTIFEHKFCRSIKVFYHEWQNNEGNKEDNFTEIIQNISRHFNDKKLMREKIVNKSLCRPLPQDIRFQEKK